jgi:hypothetical protein
LFIDELHNPAGILRVSLRAENFFEEMNDFEMPRAVFPKFYCCGALLALRKLTASPSNYKQTAN